MPSLKIKDKNSNVSAMTLYTSSQTSIGNFKIKSGSTTYYSGLVASNNSNFDTTPIRVNKNNTVYKVIKNRKSLTIPTQNGTLTYNGSSQSFKYNNYNSTYMTIGGTQSAINAGTYTTTFTPKELCDWSTGGNDTKNVSITINKAVDTITVDKTSITLTDSNKTATITASTVSGTGNVDIDKDGIISGSIDGFTITITGVATGTVILTLTTATTDNFIGQTKTITINSQVTVAHGTEWLDTTNGCYYDRMGKEVGITVWIWSNRSC